MSPESSRCLVVPPAGLEGLLAAAPICEALASSGRILTWTIEEDLAPLARWISARPELLVRSAGGVPPPPLRREDFDEAVVLDGSLGAAAWVRSAGIPSWGYRGGLRRWILRRAVPRPRRKEGLLRPEHFQDLQRAMGVPVEGAYAARFVFPEELLEQARERLERAHVRLGQGPLIGVYAGRHGGEGKPWPRKSFEELLRRLRKKSPSLQAILLATTEDLWTAVRIHEETGKIHSVLGPDLEIDVLAAVLGELDLMIAGDSELLRLAAASGTSTFGFFTRDPQRWGPIGETHHAVRKTPLKALETAEAEKAIAESTILNS